MGKVRPVFVALAGAAAALAAAQGAALAQSEVRLSDDPSYCEVFNALSRTAAPECQTGVAKGTGAGLSLGGTTQGLAITKTKPPAGQAATTTGTTAAATQATAPMAANEPRSAAFGSIQFEFGSHELTGRARQVLDTIAAVINDARLAGQTFTIEGHTDAVGSADYNQALSEQRAAAVVRYLTSQHKIGQDRLGARGKGESELYDAADPNSALNRRVVIINNVI